MWNKCHGVKVILLSLRHLKDQKIVPTPNIELKSRTIAKAQASTVSANDPAEPIDTKQDKVQAVEKVRMKLRSPV